MDIIKLSVGDVLELKKSHPCGSKLFRVLRIGSQVRVVCSGCGRDMVFERPTLEKAIKKIVSKTGE